VNSPSRNNPRLQQSGPKHLIEPMVVADFVDELEARYHDHVAAGNFQSEYRPIDLGQLQQIEQRRVALQVEQ